MGRGNDNIVVGGTDVVMLVCQSGSVWKVLRVDCLIRMMVNLVVVCSLKV